MANATDLRSVEARIKLLLNAQLKAILRDQHLAVSGVKSELQIRLLAHLNKLAAAGDVARIDHIRSLVNGSADANAPSSSLYTPTPPSSSSPYRPTSSTQQSPPAGYSMPPNPSFGSGQVHFKTSPFFTIVQPLSGVVECKARESTRDHVDVSVTLSAEVATQLQNDELYRVMVYCAHDTGLNHFSASEIAFPHQVELKVNLDDVKANLRGLKNKPGSTRPADITSFIRKKAGYNNQVTLTYALTQKKFFLVVNLVRKTPVEVLVEKLKAGRLISKEQVLREMRTKAQDPDIVATSTIMSLKCPLSTLRIDVPCRSVSCKHNQCFDASSYLQLQEQGPTWTCPVCNKTATFETLLIDQYVDDILRSTSRNIEQVTIEPEGQWSKTAVPDTPGPSNGSASTAEDEDDFLEIQDTHVSSMKQESAPVTATPPNPFATSARTPPLSSREQSVVSSAHRATKRPASTVIDLTLSDDDDDEAPRSKMPRPSLRGGGGPSMSPWNGEVHFQLPRPAPSTSAYDPNYFPSPLR
ncbi:hypothetical protein GJ744_009708 [Endocarpon pusillum]|uniref:E3 SUMO-protein ligase pli1 n=1 Tax=Endocarpon pusillum TaxID=364733 RepID=A0A8H7AS40_9EURO|nr:hypothetical protein GJ744_009708 [Endocarpon pusillum]